MYKAMAKLKVTQLSAIILFVANLEPRGQQRNALVGTHQLDAPKVSPFVTVVVMVVVATAVVKMQCRTTKPRRLARMCLLRRRAEGALGFGR